MFIRKLISTAFIAAILAVMILIARAPDDIPPEASVNVVAADNLAHFLQEASDSIYPRAVELTQAQINSYLASKVSAVSDGGGAIYKLQLKRTFVVILQGRLRVFIDQTIGGYSVYQYVDLVPAPTASGMTVSIVDGGIGRFPMPQQGLFMLEGAFGSLFNALQDVHGIFANASEITLTPGVAKVRWAGKAKAQ